MSLRSYDSLTETAYTFFGSRSTFFVTEQQSFTRVLRKLFVIDQDNETENVEPLAVPRHPSSPQIPELRTSTASKLRDFPQFRETSFFGEYSPSLNSASFFFFCLSTMKKKTRLHSSLANFRNLMNFFFPFLNRHIFFKIRIFCQISMRIMFKQVVNNMEVIRMLRLFNFHNSFIATFG